MWISDTFFTRKFHENFSSLQVFMLLKMFKKLTQEKSSLIKKWGKSGDKVSFEWQQIKASWCCSSSTCLKLLFGEVFRREFYFFIRKNVKEDNAPRSPRTQIRHFKALSFTPSGRISSRFWTFFTFSDFLTPFTGLVILQLRLRWRVGIAWIVECERVRQIWDISGNCPLHGLDAGVSTWGVGSRFPAVANQRVEDSRGTQWVQIG